MQITTLDGQRVTIHPEGGALRLSIEGEAGTQTAWLAAQPHQANDTLRHLRKCFDAVKDAASDRAIEEYEAERCQREGEERLEAVMSRCAKPEQEVCERYHPLTEENSYFSIDGRRGCRECRRESNAWTDEGGRLRLKTEAERVGGGHAPR